MTDLGTRMEQATESFVPTRDWLEGARAWRRRRGIRRRVGAAMIALSLFAAAFASLWWAFRPGANSKPAGTLACTRTWSAPEASGLSGLASISALSTEDAWAVGPSVGEAGPGSVTITEHWDGSAWSVVPSPNGAAGNGAINELHRVAMIAPDDVWAVGSAQEATGPLRPLTEHWDGTTWSIVPVPSPEAGEARLFGLAAIGPDDIWAVGEAGDALIEHWDGSNWSIVASPDVTTSSSSAALQGAVALGPDDAWAVGSQPSGVLIEHWDGKSWTVVSAPQPGGAERGFLTAVAASSPGDVWAAGWTTSGVLESHPTPAVVEHWDGSGWHLVELTAPASDYVIPLGVAAPSPRDVWVVGWTNPSSSADAYQSARGFVGHWDGDGWTFPEVGLSAPPQSLTSVAASLDGKIWLAGFQGGAYPADDNSYLQGARPLTLLGACDSG